MPGHPANLDSSWARAFWACSKCGWGLFGHFSLIYLYTFLPPSVGNGPILTEILSQRAVKPKTTNQHIIKFTGSLQKPEKTLPFMSRPPFRRSHTKNWQGCFPDSVPIQEFTLKKLADKALARLFLFKVNIFLTFWVNMVYPVLKLENLPNTA